MTQTPFSLRPFAPDDAEGVEALVHALWDHDPAMIAIYNFHRDWRDAAPLIRHTLIATVADEVVAAGTIFESMLHPLRLFLAINVVARWQRQGIGSALYGTLATFGDDRPWVVKATKRDLATMNFLERRGFRQIMSSLTGVIDPRADNVREWLASLPREVPGYTLISFDDPACRATPDEVAQVLAEIYTQFHQWNPPSTIGLERIRELLVSGTIPGSMFCVFAGDRLIGASNLFVDNEYHINPNEANISSFGMIGLDQPPALTAALLRRSIEFAGECGLLLRFEADESYVPHRGLFETAPTIAIDRDFVAMSNG